MSDKPLVSICIPNYNYARYLPDCLDSILNQTYDNIEVFFRDNCSTDNSYDIAYSYREKFKKRGYFYSIANNKENLGSSVNSKLSMRDINGDYLYVLASDDIIKETFVERCVDILNNNPNVVEVITHRDEIDENNMITKGASFYNESCIIDGESQAAVHMMAGIAIPGQRMIRSSIIAMRKNYERHFQVAGDWYNNFLYCCFGDVAYIKEPLMQYRVHSGNETSVSEKNLVGIFEHYNLLNAFKELSVLFNLQKPLTRYDEAVKKLGDMCLRYAIKMIKNGLNDIAEKYLFIAPAFKREIIQNDLYKELKECLEIPKEEALNRLNNNKYISIERRIKSYNPPEGYKVINKKGVVL
ncbi:glycosyltransferase [Clostridium sp. MSJ-8]|uniref:glycosyltransferase n=1 Tax=Clostridium sp. MSJ-8 TaxID=2841510 RepID=UPI001C0EFFB3|nr:glycosyltransferase [Clostridium sp. MSJ-8]MBU5488411.1 glycosyltransferase [Clostridium sp. MSJ-8]